MKACSKCGEVKPLDDYPRRGRGRAAYCKACNAARAREWRERPGNKERERESNERWKRNNPEAYKRIVRRRNIRIRWGMTPEQYDEFLARPCEICGKDKVRKHLDHAHASGHIRGVLCENCNRALGQFQDSPALLKRAAEYLGRTPSLHRIPNPDKQAA